MSANLTKPLLSMAPLRGITVATFRRLYAEHFTGIDVAMAPFIPLVAGGTIQSKLLSDVAPAVCGVLPTIPQVIGKDPTALQVMARALQNLGYTKLNLNCGCPWKFVAKKGRGSGLPENEDLFFQMLDAGCEAMPGGFSIKIRLGLKNPDTLLKRAERIAQYPLEQVVIHPRTGIQMYEGTVDLEAFEAVFSQLPMPVVYNGDIRTLADYGRIVKRFPTLSGVMLGRGLIADPLLAESIQQWEAAGRPESISACLRNPVRVLAFVDALTCSYREQLCGPAPVLGRLKELWGHLATYFEAGTDVLKAIQRSRTLADYEAARRMLNAMNP